MVKAKQYGAEDIDVSGTEDLSTVAHEKRKLTMEVANHHQGDVSSYIE